MPETPKDTAQDLSKLVEQSVSTLQEVDRRLQMVRDDLANLITRASTLQMQGQLPGQGIHGIFGAGAEPYGAPRAGGPTAPGGIPPTFGFGLGTMGLPHVGAFPLPPAPGQGPMGGGPARSAKEMQTLPPLPRVPSVDLVDQGDEYLVQVELPGVKKDDLDILVSERTVTVTGQARPDVGDGALLLNERGPVVYRRTLPFPTEVHTTQSKAAFKDGILTLRVPKKVPTEGPRRVDVAYG
ncbi:MAG TPA: Hsp20/alpha crystallin family protein [Candidatus Thermoplasmatota archaeon]|jgi:HSP20 family molecular chaperone IbpA|nr:Hsp20/alpha crystallin family protein [Candidatus Thermoplasmatota archaeon]